MVEVRNRNNKKVCEINETKKQVIISNKGYTTIIQFTKDNTIKVINK
ncbi:hypothetical protein [Fundicoccus culcitae]|uniref:Uncharacterized protein n=1 Tax=Fundicoccus culcitae TaxID=2969821 RepID=A0ABY5P8A1_9LACT|nr:hypothetical protein [Fundicoccus culcitae]UUX34894.1 hypothetical protein NRE15_04405 [Fundicoccus culcitae]